MQSSRSDPVERSWQYLDDRFGVQKEDLSGMELFERSGSVWVKAGSVPDRIQTRTTGFRLLRLREEEIKPTTYGLQFLGDRIEKHRVDLLYHECIRVFDKTMIPRDIEQDGYVALCYDGLVLGCGVFRDGLVSSKIPKGRAKQLRSYLTE